MVRTAAKHTGSIKTSHLTALSALDRYKLIVDNIADYAIFMMDTSGHIQTWNKGAEKIKGYAAKEIVGKHFSVFYQPEDVKAKKPERELEIAKKYGRVEDEGWRTRKDGSKFWANVVITALHNEQGELIGFAKITRNLTERKQHEDNLRQANALLKRQRRELEALNIAKDEFVSLASHQLRTRATAVKQLLGMLLEGYSGEVSKEQEALIARAYNSNERQIAIVDGLLRVAQLDAGKVHLRKVPTDLRDLVYDVIENYRSVINERGQNLTVQIPDILEELSIDSTYIRMAIENLIDNASKYTPRGGSITITVIRRANQICTSIADTGVGIAADDIKKLFTRFNRIPNDLSEMAGGSGLGLYWSQRIILLHNGKIEVSSKHRQGTTFTICLPRGGSNA